MGHYADDSMTPAPIKVGKDKFGNETVSDSRSNHEGATAGEGGFDFDCGHYDDSPGKGGFGSYGKSVSGESSAERTSVKADNSDRGKEA